MERRTHARHSASAPLCLAPAMLVLIAALTGCGGGSNLVSVSGTVKLDGKPLEGAQVMFQAVKSGTVGVAITRSDGSFTVMTRNQKGLAPGDYVVAVIKTGKLPKSAGNSETPPPLVTPAKYANPKTSGLKYTVPGPTANFELSSK